MSHNVSRGRQEEIRRKQRRAELEPFLVPGWQIDPSRLRLVEIETALGVLQRRQTILLRCRRADCRRRVELDVAGAVRAGLGDRPPAQLARMLRCQHWGGCGLEEISTTYEKGIPLIALLQHDDVLVAIECAGCRVRMLLPPAEVIRRLRTTNRGDGATGVLELGAVIRGPCRHCHRRRFQTGLVWTSHPGAQPLSASSAPSGAPGPSAPSPG